MPAAGIDICHCVLYFNGKQLHESTRLNVDLKAYMSQWTLAEIIYWCFQWFMITIKGLHGLHKQPNLDLIRLTWLRQLPTVLHICCGF